MVEKGKGGKLLMIQEFFTIRDLIHNTPYVSTYLFILTKQVGKLLISHG